METKDEGKEMDELLFPRLKHNAIGIPDMKDVTP